jgi:hypothetical protein
MARINKLIPRMWSRTVLTSWLVHAFSTTAASILLWSRIMLDSLYNMLLVYEGRCISLCMVCQCIHRWSKSSSFHCFHKRTNGASIARLFKFSRSPTNRDSSRGRQFLNVARPKTVFSMPCAGIHRSGFRGAGNLAATTETLPTSLDGGLHTAAAAGR